MKRRTSKHDGAESFSCVRVVLCNSRKDRTVMYKGDYDVKVLIVLTDLPAKNWRYWFSIAY